MTRGQAYTVEQVVPHTSLVARVSLPDSFDSSITKLMFTLATELPVTGAPAAILATIDNVDADGDGLLDVNPTALGITAAVGVVLAAVSLLWPPAVKPVFVGLMIDHVSWRAAFIVPGVLSLVVGLALFGLWRAGRIQDLVRDRAPIADPDTSAFWRDRDFV